MAILFVCLTFVGTIGGEVLSVLTIFVTNDSFKSFNFVDSESKYRDMHFAEEN